MRSRFYLFANSPRFVFDAILLSIGSPLLCVSFFLTSGFDIKTIGTIFLTVIVEVSLFNDTFFNYICIDLKSETLIIKQGSFQHKTQIPLAEIEKIKFEKDPKKEQDFILTVLKTDESGELKGAIHRTVSPNYQIGITIGTSNFASKKAILAVEGKFKAFETTFNRVLAKYKKENDSTDT